MTMTGLRDELAQGVRSMEQRPLGLLLQSPAQSARGLAALLCARLAITGPYTLTGERAGDLAALLTGCEQGVCLLLCDLDRFTPPSEILLAEYLTTGACTLEIGAAPNARDVRIDLPPLLVLAASEKPHLIPLTLLESFAHFVLPDLG